MRSVDHQTVHVQTPAIGRGTQTRHAEIDQHQRLAGAQQQDDDNLKMNEMQETDATEKSKIELDQEKEQDERQQKKRKQSAQEELEEEKKSKGPIIRNGHIDIRI